MAGERILIIEDSTEVVTFLRDVVLQPLKYEVSSVADGKQGLTKALQEQPDLILLDLNLPELSGMEVLEALRQHDCQSPVILMTSYGSERVAVRAFRLGVRDYIVKPFEMEELLGAIERALEEVRLRRERERLVTELGDANRELAQRMREFHTLQTVGRSVASFITKDKLLRRIIDAAIYLAGADLGAVFLSDEASGKLRLEALRQGKNYHSDLQIEDCHAEAVLRHGRPLSSPGAECPTSFVSHFGQEAHSLFYVPIKFSSKVIGVMGVACLQEEQMLRSEIQKRLTALADYAAIALRNAQLYENAKQRAEQLSTLNRIAMMVTSSLDMNEVMRAVVRSVNQILHVETGSLALRDEESDELGFQITLQGDTEKLAPYRVKVGQGIIGEVVQTGQPIRVNDVNADPRFYPDIDQAIGFQTNSILCVPLTVAGKVIGAIEVINKLDGLGQFTDEDERLLRAVAAFVAMAVENARLYEATRDTVATQTVRDTVVTLSHYVNNPLQTLMSTAYLLRAAESSSEDNSSITQMADTIERSVEEIAVVISVLQSITSPESTVYLGSIQMLDIEKEVQARLASIDT